MFLINIKNGFLSVFNKNIYQKIMEMMWKSSKILNILKF